VAAWSALLITGTVGALTALGVIDAINFTDYGQRLSSAVEAILLSLGLAQRINRMRRETEAAQRALERDRLERISALNQLIAGLAHEIGNPLNLSLGGARELQRRLNEPGAAIDAPLLRAAELALQGNQRIHRILANLRDYSQAREGAAERSDVAAAIHACLELVRERLGAQKIEVALQLDDSAIVGSPGELDQVLTNLILNACQAMPDGGKLHIGCGRHGGHAWIRVADTGSGIPEGDRASIFRPFFTTGHGTGLGLAVSREIVRRNGGTLELAASPVGAAFEIRWPLWVESVAA
jgi:signal transduction histidine kinase